MIPFDVVVTPAVEPRVVSVFKPVEPGLHVVIGRSVYVANIRVTAERPLIADFVRMWMERGAVPKALRAGSAAEIGVGVAAGIGIELALPAAAMVQDNVGNARNALRFESSDGVFQLGLRSKMRSRSTVLAVAPRIVIIERVVAHREPAAGRFLRHGKPNAVDAVPASHVFK